MAEAAHDHHHGDQDIVENIATFRAFGGLMKWSALAVAVLVLTLVIWFCTNSGVLTGLIAGGIVAAVGIYFLRSKPALAH